MRVRRTIGLLLCSATLVAAAPPASYAQLQRYSDAPQLTPASDGTEYNDPNSARRQAKRKATNNKIAGCIVGGILGGLLGAAVSNRNNRGSAIALGAAAGCFAGFTFASNWSEHDRAALDDETQQVMDRPRTGSTSWVAPESGQEVELTASAPEIVTQKVDLETYDNVVPPPQTGTQIIARPFRTRDVLRLRSSPVDASEDNVIGRFNKGVVVEVVGASEDGKWAMIGDDGVIAGYASAAYLAPMDSSQTLRKVATARPKRLPRTQLASAGAGARINAAPETGPEPKVRTIKVLASTQCKSVVAVSGQQTDRRKGCETPNGDWKYA